MSLVCLFVKSTYFYYLFLNRNDEHSLIINQCMFSEP